MVFVVRVMDFLAVAAVWMLALALPLLSTASSKLVSRQFALGDAGSMFTFTQTKSFIELRPTWALREKRQLFFKFRTQLAHGLLVHHGILKPEDLVGSYDLYIKLENGRLRVTHIFDNEVMSMIIGEGLNEDKLHSVNLVIDPSSGEIVATLDDVQKTMNAQALKQNPYYGIDLANDKVDTPVLFFGGLNPNDTIWARQYGYEQYLGCLGDIHLNVGGRDVVNLTTFSYAQVDVGCVDRCDFDDLCLHGSICLNHYYKVSCDCFGTYHEGPVCGSDDLSTVTLRGYSYVSYKIYEWVDKVHSDVTRISLTFRTSLDDSVLFYGLGETPTQNYVAASLKNGSIHFAIDFSDKDNDGPHEVTLGKHLHDDWWHNLTVIHQGRQIKVLLDGVEDPEGIIHINGTYHFYLDPRFYVGGVPFKTPKFGLRSWNNYVGSLREAYFGPVSILERMKNNDTITHYHGLFPPEYGHEEVEILPVTFFYPESKIRLTANSNHELDFTLDFKTNFTNAVLAHSAYAADEIGYYWQLGLENGAAIISIVNGKHRNGSFNPVKLGRSLDNGKWHHVRVFIGAGRFEFAVDYRLVVEDHIEEQFFFSEVIYVGGSTINPQEGFVGCMRQIKLSTVYMDPRNVVDTNQIEGGEISMDNCQLVDPCARPGVCEHGGKCIMTDNKVLCNCSETGYEGVTCHFSRFRRTCEELFLVGHRKKGVYRIDIDGNGPHPPAYVYCDMVNELTTTTIFTNLEPETVVRKAGMESFRLEVTYRSFTAEMLQTLIRSSKNCTQFIHFDCFKVPLGLWSYTWFHTSSKNFRLSSIGSTLDSHCECGDAGNCTNPEKMCNCDAVDQRWRSDEAYLHLQTHLGITEMFFLQPENMSPEAELRVTLGPLKCLEMDTQQYVITFKTSESFLEIPGWKTGDLAFSFRTSHKKAILFFQPSHYLTHSHFKIFLINENQLAFEFSVRNQPRSITVSSQTPLNSGEWQQVWVDYDRHHVRFTINMETKVIDLEKNEEFGPFEGTLYVGGALQEYLDNSLIKDGFVGCLRGLVINEEVTQLYSYLSPRTPQIVTGCKPSCDPNPCRNGAKCHEFWGTFKCECSNKLAHTGEHCEININANGVTFVTENGHFHLLYVDDVQFPPVLTEDILLNIRTYAQNGLLLYAHDQYSNFVQLQIEGGNKLSFTFNSFRMLIRETVDYDELNRGKSVQILVQRGLNDTVLYVNDQKKVIPKPVILVDKYRQNPWVSGQELEIVKPPRPPVEPKSYLQIYLGALDLSNMESTVPGFIGCLTGLRIGQNDIDLVSLVDDNPGTENFRKACKMSCDKNPCKNNGYCIEDWKNMQYSCECGSTSYFGKSCDHDIGGTFNGTSLVKHIFVPDASTYQRVMVHLAFSTKAVFEMSAVILFVNSKVDERNYIMVALSPWGELIIEEEDGSERVISSIVKATGSSGTFADGNRHWIFYNRTMETTAVMVDNKRVDVRRLNQGRIPTSDQSRYGGEKNDLVMVGGMEFIDNRFVNYINYSGCLSNVVVKIDTYNIYPLETAYGSRPGAQYLNMVGVISQSRCANIGKHQFTNSTPTFADLTLFVGPDWVSKEPVRQNFKMPKQIDRDLEYEMAENTAKRVGLVMGLFLVVLMISLATYLWHLDWKDKQYRYEEEFGHGSRLYTNKMLNTYPADNIYRGFNYNKNNIVGYYEDPCELILLEGDSDKKSSWTSEDKTEDDIDEPDNNSEADTKPFDSDEEENSQSDTASTPLPSLLPIKVECPKIFVVDVIEIPPAASPPSPEKTPNGSQEPEAQKKLKPILRRPRKFGNGGQPSPVFLPNNQRSFANPISYLGGPRLYDQQSSPASNRNSTESILSLD